MKGLAIILLSAFVAVQGRSAVVQNNKALAVRGENPWLVHLRIAINTSGLLETCAGSLIDPLWVLTSASCVEAARFIWIRYGALNVIHPELVTETSAVRIPPTDLAYGSQTVALISINRVVQPTANIAPVSLINGKVPESARWCGFGDNGAGDAGELLSCFDVVLESQEDDSIAALSEDGETTKFDIGSPLVADGVQIGLLVRESDGTNAGSFITVEKYIGWIESETELILNPEEPEAPEESVAVKFVDN